jgi:hypothetical protein
MHLIHRVMSYQFEDDRCRSRESTEEHAAGVRSSTMDSRHSGQRRMGSHGHVGC